MFVVLLTNVHYRTIVKSRDKYEPNINVILCKHGENVVGIVDTPWGCGS